MGTGVCLVCYTTQCIMQATEASLSNYTKTIAFSPNRQPSNASSQKSLHQSCMLDFGRCLYLLRNVLHVHRRNNLICRMHSCCWMCLSSSRLGARWRRPLCLGRRTSGGWYWQAAGHSTLTHHNNPSTQLFTHPYHNSTRTHLLTH